MAVEHTQLWRMSRTHFTPTRFWRIFFGPSDRL
jgi:hypothetical protein